MLRRASGLPYVPLLLLVCTLSTAALASERQRCPQGGRPLPTAVQRPLLDPDELLRCYLSRAEISSARSARYHDAQTTVSDPKFAGGELNPDGTRRPALTANQVAALGKMHQALDQDLRGDAIVRKFIPNADIGAYLYGRMVIGAAPQQSVVPADTLRGFIGLERNTRGLDAGATIAALGLDYETTPLGQFTDASALPLHRQIAREVRQHGLHSIRHRLSAQGAGDAKIPLAKDLRDALPSLAGRSIERNRLDRLDPYTGLGIADHLGLLTASEWDSPEATYPLRLNEEDVMTVPMQFVPGDLLLRRKIRGRETVVARYVQTRAGTGPAVNRWQLDPALSAADRAYYLELITQAAARVAQVSAPVGVQVVE